MEMDASSPLALALTLALTGDRMVRLSQRLCGWVTPLLACLAAAVAAALAGSGVIDSCQV